ncbi:hypothetical protein [Aquimarina sp. 2201CG5-10]|uniref:hypothetical protein n=1 Tax=Aquimarina callyspongiae TaxID=3098150 RepID=UPI002AB424DD|nr:hypothetical protein [Aquimarina sp. 2201CG5-10]MDY8134709.1 hypothetical protein [Aquimarina sp. 2201CG5-10]
MNTKDLTYLLQNPAHLKKEHTDDLKKIIREFPYFQPVRSLLLKGLKDQESFRYNQELKITAAYTTDRSVLFDFITSTLFTEGSDQIKVEKKNKAEIEVVEVEEIKTLPRMSMDDAVTMKMEEAEDVLDPTLFLTPEEESIFRHVTISESLAASNDQEKKEESKGEDETNPSPKSTLQIDKPLDFNKRETHSFAEWLKLTSITPIERKSDTESTIPEVKKTIDLEEKETKTASTLQNKFDLIDEFIANNPKIKPVSKSAPSRNLAKENQVAQDELMTETLARVYLAQKNYKKAIQAYKILILKNPEKSGFFADQIRAIKNLQENK